MSQGHNHLNHATWECKYHVVFTPKYRKKALFGQIRRHLGTVFRELARRKDLLLARNLRARAEEALALAETMYTPHTRQTICAESLRPTRNWRSGSNDTLAMWASRPLQTQGFGSRGCIDSFMS
jgi:Transposase IS200 like